jgi:hypothetical protein
VEQRSHSGLSANDGWFRSANCLGIAARLFFPDLGASISEAKEVCRGCAVRSECLNFALRTRELAGIWGGATAEERQQMSDYGPPGMAEDGRQRHPSEALTSVA